MTNTKKPSPETITIHQLATLANLTPRRIGQLGEEGKIPRAENGRLAMVESIKLLFAYYQRDAEQLSREKLLKTAAERRMAERKDRELAAVQSREWMLADDVKQILRAAMNRIEQHTSKVKSEAGLSDTQAAVIQKNIDDYRNQLKAFIEGMIPKPAADGKAAA
jgi:hypothetical protein